MAIKLRQNPRCRFHNPDDLRLAAALGWRLDVNRATAEDWDRLPGLTAQQRDLLLRLQAGGVQLSGPDDLQHLLELDDSLLLSWLPVLDFRWYGQPATTVPEPTRMDINRATVNQLHQLGVSEERIQRLLRERAQTLAVAESCTGGGLGAALAAVPGASDGFLGGVIAYANPVKQALLGVPAELLEAHGAVSDPVALAMAEGARRCTGADWALAITGVAGPGGGSDEKPVGLVHIAVAGPQGCHSEAVRFGASRGRHWIQILSAGEALNRLRLALLNG